MRAVICILFFFPFISYGQQYPQGYFRNPVDIPILLAGNFGECRPGHFHSGLDIKTQGRENMPVRAAAEGYVSRIKTDKGGFGHALYITHPNGYTTLYAHLNDFAPAMQKYLKQQQYEKKRWDVDMTLPPTKFPVKKGEQIAWSGNTGGSSAPHLHFEIRDTKTEHPLNPQLFGLKVVDTIAPVPREIVVYVDGHYTVDFSGGDHAHDRTYTTAGTYMGWSFATDLIKKDTVYVPDKIRSQLATIGDTLPVPDNSFDPDISENVLGIGVVIDDYMDNSGNTITFYSARLYMDDSLQIDIAFDTIGYDKTRYLNAYIDYSLHRSKQKWVQCFFKIPGNQLESIYNYKNKTNGRLNFSDKKAHKIKIVFTDNNSNNTTILFYAKPVKYFIPSSGYFEPHQTNDLLHANKVTNFSRNGIRFSIDANQLYGDVFHSCYWEKPKRPIFSDSFIVYNPAIPVHHYFDLKIKANKTVPEELKNKIAMIYGDGENEDGRAAIPVDSGWYSAKVRAFGTYWLDIDTTAPVIASMQRKSSNLSKARQISFTVKDNMTSVRTFSGYLDGKWICFEQHGDDFFYKFDEHCPKGKHKLIFKAADENGNEATEQLNFIR